MDFGVGNFKASSDAMAKLGLDKIRDDIKAKIDSGEIDNMSKGELIELYMSIVNKGVGQGVGNIDSMAGMVKFALQGRSKKQLKELIKTSWKTLDEVSK